MIYSKCFKLYLGKPCVLYRLVRNQQGEVIKHIQVGSFESDTQAIRALVRQVFGKTIEQ